MQTSETASHGTIYGFRTRDNSYTKSLYETVQQHGIEVKEGVWAGRWLLSNLRRGDTMHLHWPSFLYYEPKSYPRSVWLLLRFVILCLILRLRGVRVLWTAHNLYPHDGGDELWIHRFARWFVIRISQRIFVHGQTAAGIVRDEFNLDQDKLRIIHHGHWIGTYPNEISQSEARHQLGLSANGYVYLFLGLCKPYKGLEELIKSVVNLPNDVSLVIAGKFPSATYLSTITRLVEDTDPSRISVFPGFVENDQLQVYLNAADIVVLPYREILTSGMVMLATSFGRPVVVPRLGSLVDVVDDSCGIFYEPNDTTALGRALQQARNTVFNAETIRRHAASFTWEPAAKALIKEHLSEDDVHRQSYLKSTYTALAGMILLPGIRYLLLPATDTTTLVQAAALVLWLMAAGCGLVFVGGLVVLIRDSREKQHLPDLFYRYVSRIHLTWNRGWRRQLRPFFGSALRPGDTVRLRSIEEILATLDETGKLDGLPFMPEMLEFSGRELRVHRRIDKINDWINHNELRRTKNMVTLVDSRCNGAAHGDCQAACQILWHERWLRHVDHTSDTSYTGQASSNTVADSSSQDAHQRLTHLLDSATHRALPSSDEDKAYYSCQITELLHVSSPVPPWDIRLLLRPLLTGNVPLTGWLVAMLTAIFNRFQKLRHGVEYPLTGPTLKQGPTPSLQLDLQPGEKVRVRNKYDIGLTLYKNHNRGIWFGKELVRFCNQQYTVRSRVERIINERSGEMMHLKTPCVILESVCGSGEFLRFCPQNEYVFWREIWLERTDQRID